MSSPVSAKEFEELCAGYVLDSLSKTDRELFLELLEQSTTEQKVFFEEMKEVATELALLYPEQKPDENLKNDLIKRVWAGIQKSNVKYLSWYRITLAAAIIFFISTLSMVIYTQKLNSTIEEQQITVVEYQGMLEKIGSELSQKEEMLTILEARDIDLVMMDPMEVDPSCHGKVVWDKDTDRALLQVSNLPVSPSDKDYQLWLIVDEKPISAGVFTVNSPEPEQFFKIEELSHEMGSGAFAVTMEPKGGMPQPTGNMVLMGK